MWFAQIIGTVKPLDNIDCRKAIMYAMNSTSYQNAYGGKFAGGEIATTVLPPTIPGYKESDIYGLKAKPNGQLDKAKESLKKCGQPDGFETTIGYRFRGKEKATPRPSSSRWARSASSSTSSRWPTTPTRRACGKPSYLVTNKVGLCIYGWGADWTTGYGYLSQIVDSRTINPEGGSPNFAVRDPRGRQAGRPAGGGAGRGQACEISTQIDKQVMEDAFIYPGIYAKAVLLRGKNVTNVFINDAFG